ncbi:extracellular solute-binding protein [Paenibacillus sp. HN-1]|uniref:extracellular solute-binding protein n=1 Tax=Paenibacillus TaxID=44249 RepID=UPI001CAA21BD|nr:MULTISPECIES: extracellular solute-binding protein [Paenibacillus]MBY9079129.1 extracellular solute-binding protein [Paenibacillus sp. CGMCC 1.18879]MBY9086907.1 extracellular solute-binding protein [Paenibacillus sinensis]
MKLRAALPLLAIVLLLLSCSAKGNADEPVQLVFWTTTSESESHFFRQVIAEFEDAHPNISVILIEKALSSASNEYKTAILGGQSIDVLRADNTWIPDYADLDIIMPLDQLAQARELSRFVPTALSAVTYQGQVYGLPSVMEVPALMYNKAHLKEAGYDHPPQTMDELMAMAKALSGPERYGLYVTEDSYFALPFVWAFGGDTVTADRKIEISSTGSQKAFAFMRELRTEGASQPYASFEGWYDTMMHDFGVGKAAMVINGPWAVADLLKTKEFTDPDNLGVAPIPRGPAGQGSPIGGHSLVINRYSEHPKESYELISFLTSEEVQARQSLSFQTLPTRSDVYADPRLSSNYLLQSFKEQLSLARSQPMIPESSKLYRDFTTNLNAMLLGRETPREGAQRIEDAWKSILKLE